MNFQIKNRFTGAVQFECELTAEIAGKSYGLQLGFALGKAIEAKVNLQEADLAGVETTPYQFADATFARATFADATFADATFAGATFAGATFADATFAGATFAGATFAGAAGFELPPEYLRVVRDDFWAVLSGAPREVDGLRSALIAGRVDGSTYEGDCACLMGTIANIRNADYRKLDFVQPNSRRPIEQFFMGIRRGDTPESNSFSKQTVEWLDQWLANVRSLQA